MPLFNESQVRVILLDIEGTTTPVDFVTKELFPYASRALDGFLREKVHDPYIAALLHDLRAQNEEDARRGLQPPQWKTSSEKEGLQSVVPYCQWLIQRDSKCTPLKSLQGMIWEAGYASGELHGQVYPDVPVAFERWGAQKRGIAIYSSGSILAQQLLFRTATFGDLTKFIQDYFDTRFGAKTETASYKKIAESLGRSPSEILFISDAIKEVEAARAAGLQSLLCNRPKQSDAKASDPEAIQSFDVVFPGSD